MVEFLEKEREDLLKELWNSMEEVDFCLKCVGVKYNDRNEPVYWTMIDTEDGKKYNIDRENIRKGLDIFIRICVLGRKAPENSRYLEFRTAGVLDPDNWDSITYDALAQCAIFGGVIYG